MATAGAPLLSTVVVGAGPAGLLFVIAGRLLAERAGLADAWRVVLVDKRESYARTHRLRLSPGAYVALAEALDDPRFDELLAFLRTARFAPEVNVLERRLSALARGLGVPRRTLAVGAGPGETPLGALPRALAEAGAPVAPPLSIVAADSVHSALRGLAAPKDLPIRQKHEQLARLRVGGEGLPDELGPADRVRISKLLGSIVDYRKNDNGFAEVDLFLSDAEHARVRVLGATPARPVPLDEATLRSLGAPLFAGIVRHLARGLGAPRPVSLSSTFALEHAVAPRRVLTPSDAEVVVVLVGDAAASLPFQRGMSCLARCALALARLHVAALEAARDGGLSPARLADLLAPYDAEVGRIVRDELRVVRWRAALVRALRETIRLANLLPFPIQSLWLAPPSDPTRAERLGPWHLVHVGFATVTGALALGGSLLRVSGWPFGGHTAWAAVLLELTAGFLYRGSLELGPGPQPLLRRVWQVQLLVVFVGGVAITVAASLSAGRLTHPFAAVWSLRLAAAFLVGLYAFELVARRLARSADLESTDRGRA